MASAAPSADGLTDAQRRVLATFSALLSARGEVPQRLIVVDAEGHETEEPTGDRELSTTQAARWLRVSRQHLVNLLKVGAIPYQMVGAHHRVRLGDLRAYKERQRAALREITRIGEELGYDE